MDSIVWFPINETSKPGWSFRDAAASFFASKKDFLEVKGQEVNPAGVWELNCFPLKELVGKEVTHNDVWKLRKFIHKCRNYEAKQRKPFYDIQGIASIFEESLAYPPSPLSFSQDRIEVARRSLAIKIYWERQGFNQPPKR